MLVVKGAAPWDKARRPYCQKRGFARESWLCVMNGHAGCPLFTNAKRLEREAAKTSLMRRIPDVGLVDFIRNVHKGAIECLLCHPPPEKCTDEAVNLLVGNCKSRHPRFPAGHRGSVMRGAAHFVRQLLWPFCLLLIIGKVNSVMVCELSCVAPGWSSGVSGFLQTGASCL